MEPKKAIEIPRCNHKVCLDCYKTIYFGLSEAEPCSISDLRLPDWTFEQQFDEDGDWIENEKEREHGQFLFQKMNYKQEYDERTYDELIELRDNFLNERPEWMNNIEVIHYENELFKVCSDFRIKEDTYLQNLTIGNQSCPMCRQTIDYNV
jgi:hypothetical protein